MGKTYKESPRDVIDRIYKRGNDRRLAICHDERDFRKMKKKHKKIESESDDSYYRNE